MSPSRLVARLLSLAVLLTTLSACANGPGSNFGPSLAPDPRLTDSAIAGATGDGEQPEAAQLPPDFPNEIPRYPNAQLTEVTPTPPGSGADNSTTSQSQQTRWVTSDPSNSVQSFYQKEFQANNWQIVSQPNNEGSPLEARLNDLLVTVTTQPSSTNSTNPPNQLPAGQNPGGTEFVVQYVRNANIAASETPSVAPPDESNVGPTPPTEPTPAPNTPPAAAALSFTDLNKTPPELRQYIEDLAALGVLPVEQTASKNNSSTTEFKPIQTISHREFARWLFAANNQIYANRPSLQIREASPTAQPAFQDVPRTDPDFPVIRGLAEAGLIPSSLSGDSTAVLFRPDAPLTREQLLLWKVPLDTRQALPNASVDAVKQTWGFQDVTRIEPKALRAVLADFQNGEQSNIRRVFGYTTLFQPKKPVTRAEAAAAIWFFGSSSEGISAREALQIKRQPEQPSPPASPEATSLPSPTSQLPPPQ